MKKLTISLCILGFALTAKAQVGVNTTNPQGVFNIDAAKDNPTTGTPTATQQANDVVVDATGKVGIGTATPTNKLEINTTGANTGIKLPNGASSGKVLVSDIDGNGVWESSAVQYQTILASVGDEVAYNVSTPNQWVLFDKFTNVLADDVKVIYGSSYGWDATKQYYVVPRDGKYRISANVYYHHATEPAGQNFRAAIQLNNSSSHVAIASMPFSSITSSDNDQVNFFSGIAVLKKGDKISLKVTNQYHSGIVTLWAGPSHTLLTIESL